MPFTETFNLPARDELMMQEIKLTFPAMKAASLHMGKYCDDQSKVRKPYLYMVGGMNLFQLKFQTNVIFSRTTKSSGHLVTINSSLPIFHYCQTPRGVIYMTLDFTDSYEGNKTTHPQTIHP
jgi:hypothetical protein